MQKNTTIKEVLRIDASKSAHLLELRPRLHQRQPIDRLHQMGLIHSSIDIRSGRDRGVPQEVPDLVELPARTSQLGSKGVAVLVRGGRLVDAGLSSGNGSDVPNGLNS